MAADKHLVEHLDKLSALSQAKAFLGREFLTWLWCRSEEKDRPFKLASGETFQVWIDDKVVLESPSAHAHVNTLRGGSPSQSLEASAALLTGKSVREVKIGMNIEGIGEFFASLQCTDLSPRSLRLPGIPGYTEDEDAEASHVALRLQLTRLFLDGMDKLFTEFMEQRVQKAWEEQGLHDIRKWIKTRQQKESDLLH